MRVVVLLAAAVSAVAIPAAALAAGKVFFEDTVPSGTSSFVTIQTHRPPRSACCSGRRRKGGRSFSCSGRPRRRAGP